jgi:hypothetical protein
VLATTNFSGNEDHSVLRNRHVADLVLEVRERVQQRLRIGWLLSKDLVLKCLNMVTQPALSETFDPASVSIHNLNYSLRLLHASQNRGYITCWAPPGEMSFGNIPQSARILLQWLPACALGEGRRHLVVDSRTRQSTWLALNSINVYGIEGSIYDVEGSQELIRRRAIQSSCCISHGCEELPFLHRS